jgi:hypothetical protein
MPVDAEALSSRPWYNPVTKLAREGVLVNVIMKGYGEIRLVDSNEVVAGEITLHAEGWVAVGPVPPSADAEIRWYPNHRVAELVWKKHLAVRRPQQPAR